MLCRHHPCQRRALYLQCQRTLLLRQNLHPFRAFIFLRRSIVAPTGKILRLLFLILLFIPLCAQGILEEAIAEAYTNFYAKYPLKVQAVQVSLASGSPAVLEQILKQTKKTQDLNLQWRTPQFLSQEGLLNLSLQNKSVWVKYKIKASIQVYKSKTMLRKDQNLDQSNTYQVSIPLPAFLPCPSIRPTSTILAREVF